MKTPSVYFALHCVGLAGPLLSLVAVRNDIGPGWALSAAGGMWAAACIIAARLYVLRQEKR